MLIAADRSWLPAAPGFIGSNLAHRLVEIGNVEVTLIDSMEKDQGGNLFNVDDIKDRVSIHIANLIDAVKAWNAS